MINRYSDHIFVKDRDLGTVEHGKDHVDDWEERPPRCQRDHPESKIDSLVRNSGKEVDDGFLRNKRYSSQ